jgi:hypothetical protein
VTRPLWLICHGLAIAVGVWGFGPIAAHAQQQTDALASSSSLGAIADRVPIGEVVYVTDIAGTIVKGTLAVVVDDGIHLRTSAGPREVRAGTIRQIHWQRRDPVLNGVLIGAGIGAIPGLYWLAVDPNECRGFCAEEYGLIAAGALAGGLIDRAIKRKVLVYAAEPSTRSVRVTIHPVLTRTERGINLALAW